jgi:peptidoglycan/LPS O-acetylase OafA/YrhL
MRTVEQSNSLMTRFNFQQLQQGRLVSIDALRGVAALGVVLYHTVQQTEPVVTNGIFKLPVQIIQFLSSLGYVGVFLFFVISGFCIHLRWAKARAAGDAEQIHFGTFWQRRIRRLYPPYLLALWLFLGMTVLTTGIDVTHFFVYDLVMHFLMLHNLDQQTCYSINGVFWTLAIEEQLYLAYFLLLFLRTRWGWGSTLIICCVARIGWFVLARVAWLLAGYSIPVAEAAASHWFTWALGAIAVEAWFGVVQLPKWCRSIWLGCLALTFAAATSLGLPLIQSASVLHDIGWLLMHPAWGFGFFVLINRALQAEQSWVLGRNTPRLVVILASIGVFSYSLYLTHELVIMVSWRFIVSTLAPILNSLLIVTPATVAFAWLFYQICEKPYIKKLSRKAQSAETKREPVFVSTIPSLADEA